MKLPTVPLHHSEPVDPDLMEWIRHQVDALVGLGPGAMVVLLGLIIAAIPAGVMAYFLMYRMRQRRR